MVVDAESQSVHQFLKGGNDVGPMRPRKEQSRMYETWDGILNIQGLK